MDDKFDVIVIGGGPGGTPAAMQLAASGKKVLLVEESGKLGGACLFVGCIPSKIIKHAADEFAKSMPNYTSSEDVKDALTQAWSKIHLNMDRILNGRSSAAKQHLDQTSVTFIDGTARFISDYEVEVNNNRFLFDNAIIATGSHSFIPPMKGDGVKEVLTSEILFKQPSLPPSLLIIGGGPIGIELAQMLTKLLVKCTIMEMMPDLLSGLVEHAFAQGIMQILKDKGIEVHTRSTVQKINKVNGKMQTEYVDSSGNIKSIVTDKVLVVTGKIPSLEGLNLEATSLKYDRNGLLVNEFLETNVPGIYAAGDVVSGGPKFAHTATYETHIAANNILHGNIYKRDFKKNAWVLFSDPEIAAAGYTEKEAVEAGFDVVSGEYNYNVEAASQISGDTFGRLKFIVNRQNQEILGVHLFINGADSLSGEASLIIANKLTLKNVADAIHPHPSLNEAFGILALKMLSEHKFNFSRAQQIQN